MKFKTSFESENEKKKYDDYNFILKSLYKVKQMTIITTSYKQMHSNYVKLIFF